MVSWDQFELAAPELAAAGRRLLTQPGVGDPFLATVRGSGLPRINPISAEIIDGRLIAFLIVGSAKLADLTADGRYALHFYQDPAAPNEFQVRGRAHEILDPEIRAAAVRAWSFEPDDGYRLFEFSIEQAVLGERDSADAWPPRYTSWRSQ